MEHIFNANDRRPSVYLSSDLDLDCHFCDQPATGEAIGYTDSEGYGEIRTPFCEFHSQEGVLLIDKPLDTVEGFLVALTGSTDILRDLEYLRHDDIVVTRTVYSDDRPDKVSLWETDSLEHYDSDHGYPFYHQVEYVIRPYEGRFTIVKVIDPILF